jgi:hypothetical protein
MIFESFFEYPMTHQIIFEYFVSTPKKGSCFIVVEFLSPPKRYKKGGFKCFLRVT